MANKSALLLGSYGQTNIGDDLLMLNYLEYLRGEGFEPIYVNASLQEHIPTVIKASFPSLKVFETYRTSFFQWARIIWQVDAVYYGGGTIYKELYASTGRSKYSVITRILLFNVIAWTLRKRVFNLHIGIGSIQTTLGRLITKSSLRACAFTIFRDKTSYDYASKTLKLPLKKICHSTDGVFINPRWKETRSKVAIEMPRGGYVRTVGVNLLSDIPDWVDREEYIRTIVGFLRQLLATGNFIVFMPFQHSFNPTNDYAFMKEHIIPQLGTSSDYKLIEAIPIDTVSAYFQEIDIFVGMRFHSLLLATINKTPFVAIAYDTKCWRFIKEIGYEYSIRLEDLHTDKLNDLYSSLAQNLDNARGGLNKAAIDNYKKAQRCLDEIKF